MQFPISKTIKVDAIDRSYNLHLRIQCYLKVTAVNFAGECLPLNIDGIYSSKPFET